MIKEFSIAVILICFLACLTTIGIVGFREESNIQKYKSMATVEKYVMCSFFDKATLQMDLDDSDYQAFSDINGLGKYIASIEGYCMMMEEE